jgi:hypothetical protein
VAERAIEMCEHKGAGRTAANRNSLMKELIMNYRIMKSAAVMASAAALIVPSFAGAQTTQGATPLDHPTGAEASSMLRRHHDMQQLMQDMTREMERMRDQMGDNAVPADTQKQLAAKMKRMAGLMSRMSGLMDRPTMSDADASRQLEQMRKQMDQMSKGGSMSDKGK